MINVLYSCHLLSDIVISERHASEGVNKSLDYIPGSNFLGIVAAQLYNEKTASEVILDLFHNGKVRFGNAYPAPEGEQTLPIPLNWRKPKVTKEEAPELYLHRANPLDKTNSTQMKGLEHGYFSHQRKTSVHIRQEFYLKSSYDSDKRRAKDSQLFGYYVLPQGSKWIFSVAYGSEELRKAAEPCLVGRRSIGRSRSAQFGRVEVALLETQKQNHMNKLRPGENYLYAKSDLCLVDAFGNNTTILTNDLLARALGLALGDEVELDLDRSQLRTRTLQSWNGYRNNRNPDRQVIQKGSVIAFNFKGGASDEKLPDAIGVGVAEGLGDYILNPDFLLDIQGDKLKFKLTKYEPANSKSLSAEYADGEPADAELITLLGERKKAAGERRKLAELTKSFVEANKSKYKLLTPSQWGKVRNAAKYIPRGEDSAQPGAAKSRDLNKEASAAAAFLAAQMHGKSADWWGVEIDGKKGSAKQGGKLDTLTGYIRSKNEDIDNIAFIRKVASEMPKQTSKKENDND